MSKTVKSIIIKLTILLIIFILPTIVLFNIVTFIYNSSYEEMSKTSSIIINETGFVEVNDTIILNKKEGENSILIPLTIYVEDEEPDEIRVMIDGNEVLEYYTYKYFQQYSIFYYYNNSKNIGFKNAEMLTSGRHTIEIKYTYKNKKVIEQYNDFTVLKLRNKEWLKELDVSVKLPNNSLNFTINEKKVEVEKLQNNIYKLDINKKNSINGKNYVEIILDNNLVKDAQLFNKNYDVSTRQFFNIKNISITQIEIVLCFAVIEIILLIIILIICKKVVFEKIYIRNPQEVINPVLAEAIIDKKVGIKELIMTCIIELINKGNLKTIGNDKLELLTYTNTLEYERQILNLFFSEEGQIISLDEINKSFERDSNKTKEFINKWKNIRNLIMNKLFDDGIYSKKGENFIKKIKVICKIIYVVIIVLTTIIMSDSIETIMQEILISCGIIMVIKQKLDAQKYKGKNLVNLGLLLFISNNLPMVIFKFNEYIIFYICMLILLIVDRIMLKKVDTHIFTEKGKDEYIKAEGLKAYIKDYGLMEEKEIESSIIWEEYLSYAVAFGISDKVTNKINGNLLNLYMTLEKFDNWLKL